MPPAAPFSALLSHPLVEILKFGRNSEILENFGNFGKKIEIWNFLKFWIFLKFGQNYEKKIMSRSLVS